MVPACGICRSQAVFLLMSIVTTLVTLGSPPAWAQDSGGAATTSSGSSEPLSAENLPARLEEVRVEAQNELKAELDAVEGKHDTIWEEVKKAHPGTDGSYDDAKKKAFREELAKRWTAELEAVVAALGPALEDGRLATLDRASSADARVAALNAALREHEKAALADLKTWVKQEVPKRTAAIDPGKADAKAEAGKILGALGDDLATKFAARWSVATNDVVAKYRAPGAAERAAELAKRAERLQKQAEDDYFQELNKATGFSRIVRCLYAVTEGTPPNLTCAPALLVSAADIGEIVVRGFPTEQSVQVTAVASEDQASIRPRKGVEADVEARASISAPDTSQTICGVDRAAASSVEDVVDLTNPFCDQVILPPRQGDAVFVSVYKDRRFAPRYGAMFGKQKSARAAFAKLRLPAVAAPGSKGTSDFQERARLNLSILVSGGASQILVCVAPETLAPACGSIPVGYERWSVETGGFLAVSDLIDEELVTQPAEDSSKVQVLRITDGSNYAQETGLWVSFVPRNYPGYGLGLGLVSDSDRPLSIYFGPSLRLRTFGHRGLASLNFGIALRSVDGFDGLRGCLKRRDEASCGHGFALSGDEGDSNRVLTLSQTSPLLTAEEEYHTGLFAAIQLGFSFGPIPGPPNGQ
jgi:hypothetical protein